MIDIKANGPESSSFLGVESCEDSYFREGGWIPNPYLSNKDDVDEFSEYTLLGENNILAEAQALTSLILFFRDHLKKSFSDNSEDLLKNRSSRFSAATTVGLFLFISVVAVLRCGLLSRREALSPHSTVQYVTVVNKSDYDSPRKQLPAQVKKGFVLKASALLEAEQPIQPRLFGGGNDALINPNEMFLPSVPRTRAVRSLPNTGTLRASRNSQSSLNASRRTPLPSSVSALRGRTDNPSFLSLNRIDPSDLINGKVSNIFVRRPGELGDRDRLLETDALKAIEGHTPNNRKNLDNIQEIKGKSVVIKETEKAEARQEMDNLVNKLLNEHKEAEVILKKLKEEKSTREEIKEKEEQLRELELEISLEIEQRDYHFEETLNEDYTLVMLPRTPKDRAHGEIALSLQVYNQQKLSKKQKEIIGHNLDSYFDEYIEGKQLNNNPPGKKQECLEIAAKALLGGFDVNVIRIKMATTVDGASERKITWIKSKTPCEDKKYSKDEFKGKPHKVDLISLKLSQKIKAVKLNLNESV